MEHYQGLSRSSFQEVYISEIVRGNVVCQTYAVRKEIGNGVCESYRVPAPGVYMDEGVIEICTRKVSVRPNQGPKVP